MKNQSQLVAQMLLGGFFLTACSVETIVAPENLSCTQDYSAHPDDAAYQQALANYTSASSAPGSVIGVKKVQQPEWIGADGHSNLEHDTPFQVCSQFRSGSVTKVFTAVVVMQLYDEGLISLEATVAEVLPEIKDRIPNSDEMTVRQLLNHSSGLRHPTDDDVNYQLSLINNPGHLGSQDFKQRLENYIYDRPLVHFPGTESYYSNAGYWLLALMVEEITGKSIQENITERITQPLNMGSTYLAKLDDGNVARGYNFSGKVLKDVGMWDRADSDGDPAAGVVTNAPDLLTFGEALFTGLLVSESALDLMKETTTFPSCGGDCGYGLGIESWVTEENFGYGKNGSSLGVDANVIFFPDHNTTIVIFSNYGGGNRKDVIDVLLSI